MDDEERRRQEIVNAIPEFSAYEGQKENVMPRRQGHSAAALSTVFQLNAEEREQLLQQGHDEFARELEVINDSDDPLDVFLRYIDWTVRMYPEGHNQHSDLRGLLEETTSRFQQVAVYKDDLRYLKCWLHYMQFLDDPEEAFQLLERNGIGQNYALYYEEYAEYLEARRRYREANAIYERGIERNAMPVSRLRRRRNHFIARIERQRTEERSTQQQRSASNGRTFLGLKYDATHRSSRQQAIPSPSSSTSHTFRNPQFSVYTGPELDAPSAPIASSSTSSLRINNPSQRAENQSQVSKFAGTTLPQRSCRQHNPVPAFTVFRDDGSTAGSEITTSSTTLAERSRVPKPCNPQLQERFNRYRSNYIRAKDSRGRLEYIAVSKACQNNGGEPLSFEELRAQLLRKREKMDKPRDGSMSPDSPTEMTQETRAAWLSIDALAAGGRYDDEEAQSLSQTWCKRRVVDENDVPDRRVSMQLSNQGSSFYDTMDILDSDEDDDDEMSRMMQLEAEAASRSRKRPFNG